MFKVLRFIIEFVATLALGYCMCYFGWLQTIINWVQGLIH